MVSTIPEIFESQTMERQTAVIEIFQFFGKGMGKMMKHILPVLEKNLPLLEAGLATGLGGQCDRFRPMT